MSPCNSWCEQLTAAFVYWRCYKVYVIAWGWWDPVVPKTLSPSYKWLIIVLEAMPTKALTMEYVTACLMYNMSKGRRKNPKGTMPQWCFIKAKRSIHLGAKTSRRATIVANWSALHVFCYKVKNMKQNNGNNTGDGDDYTFAMQYEAHLDAMCKWIIDSRASNHVGRHFIHMRKLCHTMYIWAMIAL